MRVPLMMPIFFLRNAALLDVQVIEKTLVDDPEEEEMVDRRNVDQTSSSTGLNLTNNRTIEDQIISVLNVR